MNSGSSSYCGSGFLNNWIISLTGLRLFCYSSAYMLSSISNSNCFAIGGEFFTIPISTCVYVSSFAYKYPQATWLLATAPRSYTEPGSSMHSKRTISLLITRGARCNCTAISMGVYAVGILRTLQSMMLPAVFILHVIWFRTLYIRTLISWCLLRMAVTHSPTSDIAVWSG